MYFKLSTFIVPLLPLCLAEQHVLSDAQQSPFSSKFGDLVKESLDYWQVPGVAIGMVDGDDVWTEVS